MTSHVVTFDKEGSMNLHKMTEKGPQIVAASDTQKKELLQLLKKITEEK